MVYTDNSMRIYVACLAAYNSGTLYGKWIDIAGLDADEIREKIAEVLKGSPIPDAEEWAIHDYEGFGEWNIGENPDLDELAEVSAAYDQHGPAVLAYMANNCGDVDGFEDAYAGEWKSVEDYASELIDDMGELKEGSLAARYFDYEAFARDLELGGDIWTAPAPGGMVWVFNNR